MEIGVRWQRGGEGEYPCIGWGSEVGYPSPGQRESEVGDKGGTFVLVWDITAPSTPFSCPSPPSTWWTEKQTDNITSRRTLYAVSKNLVFSK